MRFTLTQQDMTVLIVGVICVLLSWCFRIAIFTRHRNLPQIKYLTRGTYATTFGDFLAFHLLWKAREIPSTARFAVFGFLLTYFGFVAALLVIFARYTLF